jgi:hypothetical protein
MVVPDSIKNPGRSLASLIVSPRNRIDRIKTLCTDNTILWKEVDFKNHPTDDHLIHNRITEALREDRPIDHATARCIAAQLHGGQASALYALASSGALPDGFVVRWIAGREDVGVRVDPRGQHLHSVAKGPSTYEAVGFGRHQKRDNGGRIWHTSNATDQNRLGVMDRRENSLKIRA